MIRKQAIVVLFVAAGAVPASCAEKNSECAGTLECAAADAGPDVSLPRDCNWENVCPVEGTGVFVSVNGSDENDGTKARPFKTFARALGRRPLSDAGADGGTSDAGTDAGASDAGTSDVRIYVCEGQYSENLQFEGDLAVYGGFSCSDWKFTGARPVIVGELPLRLRAARNGSLSDVEFRTSPTGQRGASRIAGFIAESTIVMRRASFVATAGNDGEDGSNGSAFNPPTAPAGQDTWGQTNNPICIASFGGQGGACGPGRFAGTAGGQAKAQPAPPGSDGRAGVTDAECGVGAGDGMRGSDGTGGGQPGRSAGRLGVLSTTGWLSEAGTAGSAGAHGQGGGGGLGNRTSDPCATGGSGGPGGCGGAAGAGGGAGGSSIALAIYNSQVTTAASQFSADRGGNGGTGGAGGKGQAGGPPGKIGAGACLGGTGGAGGGGGAGGAGAGGVSIGILWTGVAPTIEGQPVQTSASLAGVTVATGGRGGTPGSGGEPGNGGDPLARGQAPAVGTAGIAQAILGLTTDGVVIP